ncbi:glycine oxidase ThiO [Ochrobactrum pecoris]|uniref:D-amino-acid oxidase n=1 Tax=Brucella pecoris TaxID=867683 RepID=A0A5C5CQS0_9HYPH|nr:glycine oxidase ThiO [Brucella pecoris]MBB4093453.1 glycine oxidase [Brucella pecoris]NKW81161.1 glycine oxidase ThiO [Brucella pecoris]TNV13673.1 glycine oxidase ThiO [Brucella pecoris]
MRVTIIGAGVAGLATAAEFTDQGHTVTIIAKSSEIGSDSCSWFAGGMLAPWCEGESAEEPVVRLGQESIGWWERHVSTVRRKGTLVLSHTRDMSELRRFARRTKAFDTIDHECIDALEPDLAGRFRQGLFFSGEGHLDPRQTLIELAERLRKQGAVFHLGVDAKDISVEADITVDARGLAARDTLQDLRGVKGEMLIVRSRDINLTRPVRLLHPRIPLYIVPRGDGVHMIGATMIESDDRHGISVRSTLELLSAAYALHPAFGEAEILEIGVDARPAFPDNLPRVRRRGKTIYVNGLYRHGFLLAPAIARMAVASATMPEDAPEPIPEFVEDYA